MTHRSRSEQDESGAVPGPLYLALSLCASRQSDERIEGIKQFGRLGQKGEIALGSVLRIFVNEREPVVKAEMQRVLANSGPEIIQPSLEMVDEIVQGAATELIGVLRALAGGRLEPLVRSSSCLVTLL